MRVFEIQGKFGLENLKIVERKDSAPGPGELLIRVRAVSLNYRDALMIRGHYNPRQPLPLIPCSDGVGEVIELGEGVQRFKVGDRVAGSFSQTWISGPPSSEKLQGTLGGPIDGMLCEKLCLPETGVVGVPEYLSDTEAACLPCAALTAWSALAEFGAVGPGDRVLVQGSGGVSIFALQFARVLGAEVIATSSSDEKRQRMEELGAWKTLNYAENPKWSKEVRRLTGGRGVDHVVEVGGAATLEQSLRAVRAGGTVSVIGVLSGISSEINIIPILMQHLRLQGILVGSREAFERMNRVLKMHQIHPVIDRVFDFEDALDAFEYFQRGAHLGKVCISLG